MLMKKSLLVALSSILTMLFTGSVQAQTPSLGHHYYGQRWGGQYETLVLSQPEAKMFADGVTGASGWSPDPVSQKLIDRLRADAQISLYGGSAELTARLTGWFGLAWGVLWWLDQNQIQSGGNDWSAEVVEFQIFNGLVYHTRVYDFQDGRAIKGPGPEVYQVQGGAKFWIPSASELFGLGHSWGDIKSVSREQIANMPNIPKDGTVLRELSNPAVCLVTYNQSIWGVGHKRFHFLNEKALFNEGHSWSDVRFIPDGTMGQVPYGGDIMGYSWGDAWSNLH